MNIATLEKQEYPLLIEGTLRHQNNINIAKTKYGNTFNCMIINTNYFGDDAVIPTLVVSDDISLVLGKPRYPENFTDDEYHGFCSNFRLVIILSLKPFISISDSFFTKAATRAAKK